jgi:hypothetical protein
MLKKNKKNVHVYLHILCAHTKLRQKWIFFMACAKKTKERVKKRFILIPNCYFYTEHIKIRFFLKGLRGHVEHGDVHITYLFNFLIFLNMSKINFK